jgi:hypothetical protein
MANRTPRLTTAEEFDAWQAALPLKLVQLNTLVPPALREKLDYSLDSIDLLEAWLLEKYPSYQAAITPEEYPVMDAASVYIGETFRDFLEGDWIVELEDADDPFQGMPAIVDFDSAQVPDIIYPVSWLTAALDRRTGNFVRRQLERYVTPIE